jgi:hypothetical protein
MDNRRAQSRTSSGSGDVTAEQKEGSSGRKRKPSGSVMMGGFFKRTLSTPGGDGS